MGRVTLEQAAVNALRKHIEEHLTPVFGDELVVNDRWPEAEQDLPSKAITILRVGAPEDEGIGRVVFKEEEVSATKKLYTWRVKARRQQLQLDVWAHSEHARESLMAELERSFHVGVGKTLGIANADPFRDGPLLKLDLPGDGWEGFADFTFNAAAHNDPPGAREKEYRATALGFTDLILTFQAESPRLLFAGIAMALAEHSLPAPELSGQQNETYLVNLETEQVTHTSP